MAVTATKKRLQRRRLHPPETWVKGGSAEEGFCAF
jgi:hypothetical protein